MKKLNLFSNLWSSLVGSQCSDIGFDCRLTVGSPSGRYCSTIAKFVAVLAILLTVGVGNVWADAPTLEDLNFGTPTIDENFNSVSTTSTTAQISSISTAQSGYGIFNYLYNNNNANKNTIAISASGNNMTSNYFSLSQGSGHPLIGLKSGGTFSQKGAFRFTIEKTSHGYIGLYNSTSSQNASSRAECSLYLRCNNGAIDIQTGTSSSTWTSVGSASSNTIDICVIYNLTNSDLTYGDGIALNKMKAHVYINGTCVNSEGTPTDFSMPNNATINCFRVSTGGENWHMYVDDIKVWNALPDAAVSCSNTVSLSEGSESNGTISLGSTSIATCNETASTRQVTLSVSPSTGYAAPTGATPLTFTKSSGTVTATYKSGPTGSGPYTYVYEFDKDDKGAGTFGVTCSARTYTITLDNQSATTAGTESVSVTYNSSSNLTSAITKPTKTGYTFGGYYTMASGAGTQIIDADGNFNTNPGSSGTYTDASKNWKYTGDLELYAKWTAINYTITWKVDGSSWTPYTTNGTGQDGSSSAAYGTRVSKLPTAPTKSDGCGDDFVGWSTKNAGSEMKTTSYYNDLFETTGTSPVITQDTTFYAVFAEYDD